MTRTTVRLPLVRVPVVRLDPARFEKETIAAAFHCPVAETYGMAETAAAASECPHGRLHQWPEVGWIEVMAGSGGGGGPDEQGAESGTGDLVCTGLLNVDMPLIRYRVGDSGRVIELSD